jgi:hypothetical protein
MPDETAIAVAIGKTGAGTGSATVGHRRHAFLFHRVTMTDTSAHGLVRAAIIWDA